MRKEIRVHRLISIGTWLFIIAVWFVVTNFDFVNTRLIPTPQRVFQTFILILQNGYNGISFLKHYAMSMGRILLAVIFAIVTAIPLGLLSGYFPKVRAMVDSIVNFYRPIPPMAYYVLLIIWLGIDEESKVMLLFLAAFAPIYIACSSAVGRVRSEYILSAQSLGATEGQVFFKIILPACVPEIFIGLRTAVGVCYTTLVSSEMIAATMGIGWMAMDAYNYLKVDVVFIVIIVMGITGIIIDELLKLLGRKLVYWTE